MGNSRSDELIPIQHDPNNDQRVHSNKLTQAEQCYICHKTLCQCDYNYITEQTMKDRRYKCSQCVNEGHRKTLTKTIKNELNHSMNVIDIIIDFAVGVIADCCNIECDEEISFRNKFLFNKKTDINGKHICYYEPKEINPLESVYIGCIDKRIRLFCAYCTNQTKNCQRIGCQNKDIYLHNNICPDHPLCVCCGWISKYELSKCSNCDQTVCNNEKCSIYDDAKRKCRLCYETEEKQVFSIAVHNVLKNMIMDMNVINIIINFGMGFIVDCCNDLCNEQIVFENRFGFINKIDVNNNTIYYYIINEFNKLKNVETPYTYNIRIFCKLCTKKKVLCENPRCMNYDINFEDSQNFCSNHPCCGQCKGRQKYYGEVRKCKYCMEPCCIDCGIHDHHKCLQKEMERKHLIKLNEIHLKNICKLNNLSTNGDKIDLINTILNCLNDKVDAVDAVDDVERQCLRKLDKKHLKNICKSKGLPTNGNKQSLIEIILFHNTILDKMKLRC